MKTAPITLGNRELELPPIPLDTLAELQEEGVELSDFKSGNREGLKAMSRLLGGSLRRLYPEITDGFVLANIDAHNAEALSLAFAKVNTLEQGGQSSGETSAG